MTGALKLPLGRDWIAARIPHRGTMCLLDAVVEFDSQRIVCRAASHRALDNPLRFKGRLAAVSGVEYAAQAMAVHGALLASCPDAPPRVGMLASVRNVRAFVERLDTLDEALMIEAERLGGDHDTVLYRFSLSCSAVPILEGRAVVLLDARDPPR